MTAWRTCRSACTRGMRARSTGMILHTPFNRREEKSDAREGPRAARLRRPQAPGELAMNLPYGDQRRLEIARALASDPKLLLLDEPTAGMNPQESEELRRLMERLRTSAGIVGPADRARHEGRHERLGSHHRAGPRREDRRGQAAGGPQRPARHRGLPREPGMRAPRSPRPTNGEAPSCASRTSTPSTARSRRSRASRSRSTRARSSR